MSGVRRQILTARLARTMECKGSRCPPSRQVTIASMSRLDMRGMVMSCNSISELLYSPNHIWKTR